MSLEREGFNGKVGKVGRNSFPQRLPGCGKEKPPIYDRGFFPQNLPAVESVPMGFPSLPDELGGGAVGAPPLSVDECDRTQIPCS